MTDSDPFFESKKRLLGEILTHITGVKIYSSPIATSEVVLLEREPANIRCPFA